MLYESGRIVLNLQMKINIFENIRFIPQQSIF